MPPKSRKTTTKLTKYRADRDFNEVRAGDVLELADDHPYVATGYLEKVDEKADADAPDEERVAPDLSSTTTGEQAGGEAVATPAEGGAPGGGDEGAGGAR